MAEEDLDLVVHVGDYTYEGRDHESLADFRLNHAKYKSSPDLQAAHAAFAFVLTFDDHEVENNWAGAVSQPDGEASNDPQRFLQLRANAFQAYYEHLPSAVRSGPAAPTSGCTAVWTTARWRPSTCSTPGSTAPTSSPRRSRAVPSTPT